jgi:hypothetical protein
MINSRFKMLSIALAAVFLMPDLAYAQRGGRLLGGGTYKRSSSGGENIHWTLSDWMTQKANFRLMDQWLAVNTQRQLFELNLEGGQVEYEVRRGGTKKDQTMQRYSASIYVSIFGIEGGVEDTDEDLKTSYGQFNVRLMGDSSRNTNLVLGYGVRKREDESVIPTLEVTNQYGNVKLQLYVFSFFGIDGTYRKDIRANDQQKTQYEGERAEYGAFLEYEFVRIYGKAFKDTTYKTPAGGVTQVESRDGIDAGVKFFF